MKKDLFVLLTGQFLENGHRDIHETKMELVNIMGQEAASRAQWKSFLSESHFSFAHSLLKEQFEIVPVEDERANALVTAALAFANTLSPAEIMLGMDILPSNSIFKRFNAEQRSRLSLIEPKTLAIASLEGGWISREALFRGDQGMMSVGSAQAFDLASSGWNHALVEYVIAHENAVSAAEAIEAIDPQFSGLKSSFQSDRESLKKALSSELRWIEEGNEPILYHKNHPKFRPVPAQDAVKQLTFGQGVGSAPSEIKSPEKSPASALPAHCDQAVAYKEIAERASFYADQAQWRRTRNILVMANENIQPQDQKFLDRGKKLSIDSWMNEDDQYDYTEADWDNIRNSYELISETASLMSQAWNNRPSAEQLYAIAKDYARSVCLLKSLMLTLDFPIKEDPFYQNAIELANRFARDENANLPYRTDNENMKISGDWEPYFQSIRMLRERYERQNQGEKNRKKLVNRARYHLKKGMEDALERQENWQKVIECVTTLCNEEKVPYSSIVLRDLLSPFVDDIPEDVEWTEAFDRVVQEIYQYLESRASEETVEEVSEETPLTESEKQVRERYGKSKIVFVGGTPTQHIIDRIENRFDVSVNWEPRTHGESLDRFQKVLNDPEVTLFLVYIPWCSHLHSLELAKLVKANHKDFVRLRKGTNTVQIAHSICQQVKNLSK